LNSQNIQIKIIQIYEILKIKKIISIYLVSNLPKNS
jgi:hypothetical protein